jgi:hypothetical protein
MTKKAILKIKYWLCCRTYVTFSYAEPKNCGGLEYTSQAVDKVIEMAGPCDSREELFKDIKISLKNEYNFKSYFNKDCFIEERVVLDYE